MEAAVIQTMSQTEITLLDFAALAGALLVGVLAVFLWVSFSKNKRKRKRKHHGHGRLKPTLSELGGLPPLRPADEKPPAENPPFDP